MSEITAITEQVKDKTRCSVYVDGRFCCGLTLETVMKNRLKVGQAISAERLMEIQLESEKNTALDKALNFISRSQKTEKQIADYLAKKGYLPAVCEYVLEKMRGYSFVDDGQYAKAYAENALSKKGKRLIKAELKVKGVGEDEIDRAMEELDPEQELSTAKRLLEKYMRNKITDKPTLQKAYRYLLSKGYDYDTAKSAMESLGVDDE